ncbi:MAG: hypothetical protein AAF356_03390 [Planctomycetota bacterium]
MSNTETQAVRTLLTGLIDYAGLFPPASLSMSQSATNYARELQGAHAYALGRFLCPVSRLDELSTQGAIVMPGTYATSGYQEMIDAADPWSVGAILDTDLDGALDAIDRFTARHAEADAGRAHIDAIEMRVDKPGDIDEALDEIPEDLAAAFELPKDIVFGGDPRGFVAALAGNSAACKVRCGGVTPDAIPSPGDLARVMVTCVTGDVPMKLTAGLHHPIRAEYPLTYDDNPPTGVMHGFMNVFIAAALLRARAIKGEAQTADILSETDQSAFVLTDEACGWRDITIEVGKLARARESFALGYGSCSFEEPIGDLQTLGRL